MISGFWVARILGPLDFGVWNAVSLVLLYGAYLEFGILSAMGRDLPFYLGQGNIEKAVSIDGTARRATVYGAFLGVLFVFSFSYLPSLSPTMALGLRAMAAVLILQQVYTYHRIVLRSNNKFGELSRQQALLAVLNSGLAVVLVVFFALEGRMIAAILAQAAIVLFALWKNPWQPVPKFEWHVFWSLMRVGIPIIVSGFIISLLITIDRLMVINFLGEKQLGYFGLAILLTSVVSLIPAVANQVLYPRITFQFGNFGKNVESLRSFVLTPPKVLSVLLPVLIGMLYLSLPLIISVFLPAYSQGITAARIVIVGIYFYGILGLTDYFLVTIGKLKQYALFGCCALLLNLVLDGLFLWLDYGIEGIAVAGTLITYFFYSCIVIGYALSHYTKRPGDWARFFIRLWLPFIYMMGLLWFSETVIHYVKPIDIDSNILFATVAQNFLYLLGCVPLIYTAMRELKVDFSAQSFKNIMK